MATHAVNMHDAKTRLSELIRCVEAGDDVILARNGRPVAKIVPWPPVRPRRVPGAWAGRVRVVGDLVGSDDDVVALFAESETGETNATGSSRGQRSTGDR